MLKQSEIVMVKEKVRAAFDASAVSYDPAAVLQQEIANRLLERMQYIRLQPERIVDIGTGTGQCIEGLKKFFPKAKLTALDLSINMLKQCKKKQGWWSGLINSVSYINADAENLPLATNSVDLLFSNLAIQWCNDLQQTFSEFMRVLRPGGLLMFTTFGPDTLKELRSCWSKTDRFNHVNQFVDMHDIGDALVSARFAEPVIDMEMITMTYPSAIQIMKELKLIGAHNVTRGRSRQLTGKGRLQSVIQEYEAYRKEGVLPVSYEVVYGHAWIPEEEKNKEATSSRVLVSVSDIKQDNRHK